MTLEWEIDGLVFRWGTTKESFVDYFRLQGPSPERRFVFSSLVSASAVKIGPRIHPLRKPYSAKRNTSPPRHISANLPNRT